MNVMTNEFVQYLQATIGFDVSIQDAPNLNVPILIRKRYDLQEVAIHFTGLKPLRFIALLDTDERYPGAVALKKQMVLVGQVSNKPVVYVSRTLLPGERKSMISQLINFITIGKQFFAPEIGICLHEAYKAKRAALDDSQGLSPATQAILIANLLQGWDAHEVFTSSLFSANFDFSRMTSNKVVTELEQAGVIQHTSNSGRARIFKFADSREEVLEKALPHLRSPVLKVIQVDRVPALSPSVWEAGETALSRYSLLVGPKNPVVGMTRHVYNSLVSNGHFRKVDSIDEAAASVEIWSYESLKAVKRIADEISLYLSLRDHQDERVQIALDEMKEQYEWMKFEG